MLWNVAIIVAFLVFNGRVSLDGLLMAAGWGALVGGVLQFLIQLPWVLKLDREIRINRGRGDARSAKWCATRALQSWDAAWCR